MLLPLSGNAGMAVQESGNKIGLVAIDFAGLAPADKIAEQGLGNFRIYVGSERLPQHGGRDGHVEHVQPAIHARESFGEITFTVAKRERSEAVGNRNLAAEHVLEQLLIKTLDGRQNR